MVKLDKLTTKEGLRVMMSKFQATLKRIHTGSDV